MSIEKVIEANTAAVEKNTAALEEMIALQKAALARLDGAETPAKEETPARGRGRGRSEEADTGQKEETNSRRSRREEAGEETGGRASRRSAREEAGDKDEPKEETGRGRGRSRRGEEAGDKDEPKEETGTRRSRRDSADKKDDGKKKLTSADIRAEFAKFLEVDAKEFGDEAEKEEEDRRGFVEAIFDELAIDKATEVKPEDFDRVLDWLKRFADGENVRFDND